MSRSLILALVLALAVLGGLYAWLQRGGESSFTGSEVSAESDANEASGARRAALEESAKAKGQDSGDPGAEALPEGDDADARDDGPAASLGGRMVDDAGAPVSGASVRVSFHDLRGDAIRGEKTPSSLETTTDATGRFRFARVAHRFELRLRLRSPQHMDVEREFALRAIRDVDLGDIVAHRGASVEGRVTDDRGVAVAGATVRVDVVPADASAGGFTIVGAGDPALSEDVRETQTDEDGRYRVSGLGHGELTVEAENEERPAVRRVEPLLAAGEIRRGVDVVLEAGRTLNGIVRDDSGVPVAGVQVRRATGGDLRVLFDEALAAQAGPADAETDSEGRFSIAGLKKGTVLLRASKPGWRTARTTIGAVEYSVEITLRRASVVGGYARDVEGAAIEGLAIEAGPTVRLLRGAEAAEIMGIEDEPGVFALVDLPRADVTMKVHAPGYATRRLQIDRLGPGEVRRRDLTLQPAVRLAGRVVRTDGSPGAGAKVQRRQKTPGELEVGVDVIADAEGRFAFEDAGPGMQSLIATLSGALASAGSEFELGTEPVEDIVLTLGVGGDLVGRVVDALDEPIIGGIVILKHDPEEAGAPRAGDREVLTDLDGRFAYRAVPPGRYKIEARRTKARPKKTGFVFFSGPEEVAEVTGRPLTITADRELEIELVLTERPSVAGTVRITGPIPAGTEVRAVKVKEKDETDRMSFAFGGAPDPSSPVAADGRYEIDDLAPGDYDLILSFPGVWNAATERVKLETGQFIRDFRVATGSLSGVVRDAEGRPQGARVTVGPDSGRPVMGAIRLSLGDEDAVSVAVGDAPAKPASDGRYRLPAVPVGTHRVQVEANGHSATLEAVIRSGSETTLDFTLDE
ncbi:MAG: carboxypeptidase regulatory-like domain-containing protein [Planctomycetota bacterium]